jgi:uroporphyrinogen-III synthase
VTGGAGQGGPRLRALITRPRHQAGRLAARFRARGIGCLVEPLLEIEARALDPAMLAGRQAVLLTSPNGADALVAALAAGAPPPPLVLAVGTATARPLRRAGAMRVEAAPGSDALDLLRLARAHLDPRRGPIAYLSGAEVACDLGAALAESGLRVERSVVYAARPAGALTPRAKAALAAGGIQLAPFLSARTATRFVQLLAEAGLAESCRAITGLALSPRIATAMQALPFRAVRVAPRPDLDGLLQCLDGVLAEMSGRTAPGAASLAS